MISLLIQYLLSNVLLNLHVFVYFSIFILVIDIWFHTITSGKYSWYDFHLKFINMFCGLSCDLSWRMSHIHLRWVYILGFLGEMLCICLFGSSGMMCGLIPVLPYWVSIWMTYSLLKIWYELPFFNLSLKFAIRSLWSKPQSVHGLVFADCIELLHLLLQRVNQSGFDIDHLVMSICRVVTCIVGRGCLLWQVCSLGKTLLAFALLHFVL